MQKYTIKDFEKVQKRLLRATEVYTEVIELCGKLNTTFFIKNLIFGYIKDESLYTDLDDTPVRSQAAKVVAVIVERIAVVYKDSPSIVSECFKLGVECKSIAEKHKTDSNSGLLALTFIVLFIFLAVILFFTFREKKENTVNNPNNYQELPDSTKYDSTPNKKVDYSISTHTPKVTKKENTQTQGSIKDTKIKGKTSVPQYEETYYDTGDVPYKSYYGEGEFDYKSLSELTIINHSNSDAVVLLVSTQDAVIRNNYIDKGDKYIMKYIPYGMYIIKVMYGNSWKADKDNGAFPKGGFMKDESFSKTKWRDSFDFIPSETYEGITYPVYSVTLHTVVNGNLKTDKINKQEFFN